MSVCPEDIEGQLKKEIGQYGISSFDIGSFFASNYPQVSKKLQFQIRDLPSLKLIAASDIHGYTLNRIQLFESAVNRILQTIPALKHRKTISSQDYESISPEFNDAWTAFAKSPTKKTIGNFISELGKLGIKPSMLANLENAWKTIYKPVLGIYARYETLDKLERKIHVFTSAPADTAETSLDEYRINELSAAHRNVVSSPISVVSIYPGSTTNNSFVHDLTKRLYDDGFAVNVQAFSNPNLDELRRFALKNKSEDKKSVVVFMLRGSAETKYNADMLELLRSRFIGDKTNAQGIKRIVFLINTTGETTYSTAKSLTHFIRNISNKTADIPAVGINLKTLNKNQAGEMLYGENALDLKYANRIKQAISFIGEQIPLLPSTIEELRSIIRDLKSWEEVKAAILDYALKLSTPNPDDLQKPLLTKIFSDTKSNWYRNRLLVLIERKYDLRLVSKSNGFDEFKLHIIGPIRGPVGSSDEQNGRISSKRSEANVSHVRRGPRHAKDWGGFFDASGEDSAPPPTLLDPLQDKDPEWLSTINAILNNPTNSAAKTTSLPLQALPIVTPKTPTTK